jgi:hypothetical protein
VGPGARRIGLVVGPAFSRRTAEFSASGPSLTPVLTAGYDNAVSLWDETIDDERPFSAEERREIADAMIARWNAWAART